VKVGVIIPALDEEGAIGGVVAGLIDVVKDGGHDVVVVVVDNGSKDHTSAVAAAAGAVVVHEPQKGYGRACLAGMAVLKDLGVDVVVFADGDGSDDPRFVPALLRPVEEDRADLVIGSREKGLRLGLVEQGSLTRPQRFGNQLAGRLLALGYGQPTSDLGPFRAIRASSLSRLEMDDLNFGWTVQMQARAARRGLRTAEVAVAYRRRRTGRSKVSGDLKGSVQAGVIILRTLWREAHR